MHKVDNTEASYMMERQAEVKISIYWKGKNACNLISILIRWVIYQIARIYYGDHYKVEVSVKSSPIYTKSYT